MRIKSYFDSSIQTAMRQARHEFGESVMLVTSRVASPGFRYLGHFEVVFAVDDNETGPKAENPPQPDQPAIFEDLYRHQLTSAAVPVGGIPEASLGAIYSLLLDLGLELAVAESLVALIRSCSPCLADQRTSARCVQEAKVLSTAGALPAHHTVHMIAGLAQDRPRESTPVPDAGGTTPGCHCPSEETAATANPPVSAWMDRPIVSDGPRPSAPLSSGTAPIEPGARLEETAIQSPPGEMPGGRERAEFPAAGHEVSARLPVVGARSMSEAVDALVIALGTCGVVRRSGS